MSKPKRADLVYEWKDAIHKASFLTPKHDPDKIPTFKFKKARSVLSNEAKQNLSGFIDSNNYKLTHYEDTLYKGGSGYITITPNDKSFFNVAGSGIACGSTTPSGNLDTLVVVWGPKQKWHVYAEDSAVIAGSVVSGRLVSGKAL